jgi:two-component system heavy metal sensor histidine kinase CusS
MFWRSKRPRSLALKLAEWYAGSAFLLLVAGTGFLYWKLVQSSNAEDDQYLTEKANTIHELLRERDFRTLKWEVEGESAVRPGAQLLSRVSSADGRILVETTGMSDNLTATAFPANGRKEFRKFGKRVFRVLSEQVPGYQLQVALEVTPERNLFGEYRENLLAVLGIGLLVSAMIGYGIARKGIRPVEEIASTVRRIRSSTLNSAPAVCLLNFYPWHRPSMRCSTIWKTRLPVWLGSRPISPMNCGLRSTISGAR